MSLLRSVRAVAASAAVVLLATAAPIPAAATTADGDYTSLRFFARTSYFMPQGEVRTLTPTPNSTFKGSASTPDSAAVQWNRGFTEYWSVGFRAGTGNTLAVGDYTDSTPENSFDTSTPNVGFGGPGKGCDDTGKFTIYQIEYAGDGSLSKLSATFECGTTVSGSVAFHADQPAKPVPHGPPDPPTNIHAVGSGTTTTLSWTNPADSFSDVVIGRRDASKTWSAPDPGEIVYTGSGQSVQLSGLPNTTYIFSFTARNSEGVPGPQAFFTAHGSQFFDVRPPAPARQLTYGKSTFVSAGLREPYGPVLVGQPVQLWSRPAGTTPWTLIATRPTESTGYVEFPVGPTRSTEYRLTFAGTTDVMSTVADPLQVTVVPSFAPKAPAKVKAGKAFTITTKLKPLDAATKVQLVQLLKGHKTKVVATAKPDKQGVVRFTVTPKKKGVHSYRISSQANRSYGAWDSYAVSVKVK